MACLETKPHMYSNWCAKILKDNKFKVNLNDQENQMNQNKMDAEIDSSKNHINDIEMKILSLKNLLNDDLQAADFKWSLFVAACNTYKHDSCLKPFPPMFIKNESKDIEALREAVENIPPLAVINERLDETNAYQNYKSTIDLLFWVLITMQDPYLKSVCKKSYDSILEKVPSELSMAKPNLIFQVMSSNESSKEDRWKLAVKDYSTFFAYHGSRLENFHSILHYGIQQHMSQNGLFGKGIYLSSELGVSLQWAPVGYGWGGSAIGSEMSCVALCELVDHPDVKKGDSKDTNAFQVAVGKKVPNKYYLALNSDLVRIRYLLVYSQDFRSSKRSKNNSLIGWFKENKFLTLVFGYFILLVSVGLTHNKKVEKYYKFFIQKMGIE